MAEKDPDRAERIAEIFDRVIDLSPGERTTELGRLCGNDAALQEEVRGLIEAGATRSVDDYVRERMAGTGESLRTGEDVIGSDIGPYTIKSEIGRGGMGVVYFGVRQEANFAQRAAVKVIKRGFDTEEVLRRFELERQVLNALNHPNIARVFDGGTTSDGRPYFAMEYVEGLPIAKYCDNNRLSTRERLKLFSKVCDAVQYAHQNLIVHRDIKPTNIIVTPQGEPKLLDFGIAKMLNAPLFQARAATSRMMRLMTPEYASPEQVRGDPVGTTSDVYSLGVLLYELLTGRRPYRFTKNIEQEIVRVICEVDPERPSTAMTHNATIDHEDGTSEEISPEKIASVRNGEPLRLKRALRGDIDVMVLKALEKTPGRRYGSAQLLADDIVNYLSGLPVRARPASNLYKARKFVRRNRTLVTSVALVMLTLMVGVVGTTWQWRRAEASAERARATADAASGLSEEMITELPRLLNPLAGTLEARKKIAETIRAYLTDLDSILAEEPSDDRASLIAGTQLSLGRVFDDIRGSSLGLTNEAIDMHTQASETFERLSRENPLNERYRISHGASLIYLGDLARKQLRYDDAEQFYEDAISVLGAVRGANETRLRAAIRRNGAYESLATIAEKRGDLQKALEIRRKNSDRRNEARQLLSSSASVDDTAEATRNVASGFMDVAKMLWALGRTSEALTETERALELRRSVISMAPDKDRYTRDLAYNIASKADILVDDGRQTRAASDADRAVELMREVYERDLRGETPDARNLLFLGEILRIRSRANRLSGDLPGALESGSEAVEMLRERVSIDPSDADSRTYYAQAMLELGLARHATGDLEGSASMLTESLNTIAALHERNSLDTEISMILLECRVSLCRTLLDSADSLDGFDAERLVERAASSLEEAESILGSLRSVTVLPPRLAGVGERIEGLVSRIEGLDGS